MSFAGIARWIPIAALVLAPALAGAQPAPEEGMEESPPTVAWDQAQVTRVAQELADSLKDLRRAVRQQPDPGVASLQSKAFYRFSDELRVLESESKQLARALEAGGGHDETVPVYERMQRTIRDAREEARRLDIPAQTRERIDAARAVLDKLDQYY